jgi:hypothetical protein
LATLTLGNSIQDVKWTADMGVSNHMTGISKILSNLHSSLGFVLIVSGNVFIIKAIGDTLIKYGTK